MNPSLRLRYKFFTSNNKGGCHTTGTGVDLQVNCCVWVTIWYTPGYIVKLRVCTRFGLALNCRLAKVELPWVPHQHIFAGPVPEGS